MSASGTYVPPMFIFPRMKRRKILKLGLPPESWAKSHNTECEFLVWFQKFEEFPKASKNFPVLLILDGREREGCFVAISTTTLFS